MHVSVISGSKGELTVEVDGHMIAQKIGDKMPDTNEILETVRHEPAHS